MRLTSILCLGLSIFIGISANTWADQVRIFTGMRQAMSGAGTSGCETRPLTLRLQNGVISDTSGCRGTVGSDGRFKGNCPSANVTLYFDGTVAGDTVTLDVRRVGRGWECKYHADLKATAQ